MAEGNAKKIRPEIVGRVVNNAYLELKELLPQVLEEQEPKQKYFLSVSHRYRRVAIGRLLVDNDAAPFAAALFNSGRAFLHGLRLLPPHEKLTSKSEPFFDAIACGDRAGALEIAQLSNPNRVVNKEYEEDFFYPRFFMTHFLLGASREDVARDLEAFGSFAVQSNDERHALCQALFEKDQQQFDAALEACLKKREADIEKAATSDRLHPDAAETTAVVWTEALAWLQFAQQAGLRVADEYPFAPALARNVDGVKFPAPDSWKTPLSD